VAQAEFPLEAVGVVRCQVEMVAWVDAAKSGCGFTNERHNKKKSSRR